jgi:AcrR family transcriptional regulator
VSVNRHPAPGTKREYRSPLREQNARRTRSAVVEAAARFFVERGYAATSFADIAEAAGVSRPTAFAAFGSKSALLHQVLDQAMAGDDEPVPVAQRPWFRPVWEATEPGAVVDAYAEVCKLINGRSAKLIEVIRRAADDSPEVAELWETIQRNRRAGAAMVMRHLASLPRAPRHFDIDRATDVVWIFNDPAHYDALVRQCGWTEDDYSSWTADQIRHALGIAT